MPTTAADTLIPHTPGGGEGMGESRDLLQLQQQVGERCLVRWVHWPWTTDRPVGRSLMARITLHGDDARCVYGRVTH